MKTKKNTGVRMNCKLLFVLPVIAITIVAFSSCSKNKISKEAKTEIALPLSAVSMEDSVFLEVDEMPLFPNGDKGLLEFIAQNTNYPEEAKKNNISGKVLVQFVINKDCSVSQVKVVKGVNPALDTEALRVVSSLPKYEKPARKSGNDVSVQFIIPISFTLK